MHLSEFIYDDIESYGSCIVSFSMIDLDETQLFDYLQTHKQKLLYNALDTILSTKVIDVALAITEVSSKKIADMKHADLKKLCYFLTHMEIKIDHVADKEQAYVNKGGIDTKALDPKTMEVKHVKGLYFVGEVTDIHGPIGGYNHTIAMSSGYASARAVIENIHV
jgi:predicted flavoprotein YhiN